ACSPAVGSGLLACPAVRCGRGARGGSGAGDGAPGDARDRAGPWRNGTANPENPMNAQAPSLREALTRGRTLPAEWYTNPKLFEREAERIFAASWNYVGRVEQVARA